MAVLRTVCCYAAVLLCIFTPLLSAQKAYFDAASIKPNVSGSDGGTMGLRGRRFVATNVPLSALLSYAFAVQGKRLLRQEQVIGLPSWGNTDRFDVEAVSEDTSREIPLARVRSMLQSLLEERFNLKSHQDTRDLPVYALVLNKQGPKLSEDQSPPDPHTATLSFSSVAEPATPLARGAARFSTGPGMTTITAKSITTSTLIDLLQGQTDRIVLDRTELKALFDIRIEFTPARAQTTESGAASVFTAIQESGFRLDSTKEPIEVLIIDSVQEPSSN